MTDHQYSTPPSADDAAQASAASGTPLTSRARNGRSRGITALADRSTVKQAWLWYTVLRLVFFLVPFALLMWTLSRTFTMTMGVVTFAAVTSALVAFALSVIVLAPLRNRAASGIQSWRHRQHERNEDAEVEDAILDQSMESDAAPDR